MNRQRFLEGRHRGRLYSGSMHKSGGVIIGWMKFDGKASEGFTGQVSGLDEAHRGIGDLSGSAGTDEGRDCDGVVL